MGQPKKLVCEHWYLLMNEWWILMNLQKQPISQMQGRTAAAEKTKVHRSIAQTVSHWNTATTTVRKKPLISSQIVNFQEIGWLRLDSATDTVCRNKSTCKTRNYCCCRRLVEFEVTCKNLPDFFGIVKRSKALSFSWPVCFGSAQNSSRCILRNHAAEPFDQIIGSYDVAVESLHPEIYSLKPLSTIKFTFSSN